LTDFSTTLSVPIFLPWNQTYSPWNWLGIAMGVKPGRKGEGQSVLLQRNGSKRHYTEFLTLHKIHDTCDFFVDPELKLNTIRKKSWKQVAQSKRYLYFGEQKSHWHAQCKICEYLEYCGGDCLKHRPCGRINPRHPSLLCSGWQQFFKHTLPGFEKLAERIRAERLHSPLTRF
jgi:radical SAM protein with 4Fe4S-binding SPASM domain